jgi:N-glycosylase/DNA lyase
LLSSTAWNLYGSGLSIKSVLKSAQDARQAREVLIRVISGFGPKQASLFLRRIGYCSELAVLDTHVLDYLRLSQGLDLNPARLSRLNVYETVETEFKRLSESFGHDVGCVDLAMWVTMRVAKRERVL